MTLNMHNLILTVRLAGDVLGKLYIDRVKYTPFYGRAESTLKNKCNNNIHCLSNLYGLGDSIKTDGKATGMKNKEEVIGTSIDFGEAYVAGRMSIPLGAFEAFMFIKDHMIDKKPKNSEEAIKEVYLTAVAIIENKRMQAAHDIYVKEKTDLEIFEDGISSQKNKGL
ncbi:hypothetical protein [Pseudoleptotrichia goodfellowii]|uniref:Uncharacterized protein n=1 Tax=Pseudoleptotrichia goodfellowii TaxID=157692 RepID=A0A510J951_9FUSO|nr:hypothetical protein [Pseudoleptotrichia goodfellowii]BBM35830.1 hypothetical protein JCM16774_0760 [Pseudoleptotrichia goodfellowii]